MICWKLLLRTETSKSAKTGRVKRRLKRGMKSSIRKMPRSKRSMRRRRSSWRSLLKLRRCSLSRLATRWWVVRLNSKRRQHVMHYLTSLKSRESAASLSLKASLKSKFKTWTCPMSKRRKLKRGRRSWWTSLRRVSRNVESTSHPWRDEINQVTSNEREQTESQKTPTQSQRTRHKSTLTK